MSAEQNIKNTILFAYYSELANTYFMYKSMKKADTDYTLKYVLTCKPLPENTPPDKSTEMFSIGSKVSDWRGNMYEILTIKEI